MISGGLQLATTVVRWLISSMSLSMTFLYAMYVAVLWFTASIGYWKGYPTDLTIKFMVALYVLPFVGLASARLGSAWCPMLVDDRVVSVITGVGGAALLAASVLLCLPIVSVTP